MTRRPKRVSRLVPLWFAAALLLGAGVFSSFAQEPVDSAAVTATQDSASPSGISEAPTQPAEGVPNSTTAQERANQAREQAAGGTVAERAVSLLGLIVFTMMAVLLSANRRAIDWRLVAWGIGLQFLFALLILKTPVGLTLFNAANDGFNALIGYTVEGARFLFGNLVFNNIPVGPADGSMGPIGASGSWANAGAYFAFNVLPTIIFFSSLMTLLYHLGVMQAVVKGFGWVMMRTMKISGAESLSTAGNIFLGQTEAPLLVKPYISTMTKSELHTVMVGGFGTIAGGVLAAYVGILIAYFPDIAGHLISASVMSAPACLAIAKIMLPETEEPVTRGTIRLELEKLDANVIDAAARGASEGLRLAANVGAMLLAFIALLALANGMLSGLFGLVGFEGVTIQAILGWVGAPLAWLMGTPWRDALEVGTLIGEKTALNEFVAYLHLGSMLESGVELSPRSVVIATYALCGFANFSSIAIQIGGIGGMAPERRHDLSRLGLSAMVAGTLANFMTACVVGILL
jgi:concentrative nucleoside transporter, CNT family